MAYRVAAESNIGVDREKMEDYMAFAELGDNLFCVMADGTGSREGYFQPAHMVITNIIENIRSLHRDKPAVFNSDPVYWIERAMRSANSMLGDYKIANEAVFCGYAASVTCCYCMEAVNDKPRRLYFAHAGNTRLYLLRDGMMHQLTKDHTVAARLLEEEKIDEETYHMHPQKLDMTSGLGIILDPEIHTAKTKMRDNDILVLTTDGIHYAIRPEPMAEIILGAGEPAASARCLIEAARDIIKYPDNMAAMIIA